jgi:hypothetical protein
VPLSSVTRWRNNGWLPDHHRGMGGSQACQGAPLVRAGRRRPHQPRAAGGGRVAHASAAAAARARAAGMQGQGCMPAW